MKILVTGGAGFIGSNFVHYYLNAHLEDSVITLDALTYAGNLENLVDLEGNDRHKFVKGSITDEDLVSDLVSRVDAVVNFAAESHVDRSILDSGPFVETNVRGTQILLDACMKHGKKRFHQVSTDEVFGSLEPDAPAFTEETPIAPRNPYSATKAAADHLVYSYFVTHGLPVTISNASNNYGPHHFPEKVIPLFISKIKNGEKIPLYGDGQQIRDWLYVEDHCSGIDACLQKGRFGERYLLGSDNEMKNIDLTKMLIKLLGASEDLIEFVKDRPGHDRRYATDCSKAERELGWKAKYSLEEGMDKTIKWFDEHQDWVDRCKSGAYREYYEQNYGNK